MSLFSKSLLNAGFEPVDVGAVREIGTTIFFATFLLVYDRSAFKIRLRDIPLFFLFAFFNVASNLTLFTALEHIPVGMASVLQMTNPYFVMIFSLFLFGIRITGTKIIASVVTLIGCILIIGLFDDPGDISAIGIGLAVFSAITLGAFTIGGRFVGEKGYSENTAMMYFFGFSALMMLPLADGELIFNTLTTDMAILFDALCLCLICTLIVNFLIIYCTRRMDPGIFSIILSTSVVVSAIIGLVFFNESLRPLGIVGIGLVIVGMVILEWRSIMKGRSGPDSLDTD